MLLVILRLSFLRCSVLLLLLLLYVLAARLSVGVFELPFLGAKKTNKQKTHKHFLTALGGQSSQGRTPTRPRDKRDKMAILLWNSTEKGQFVPVTGPILSRGGVPFVPGTVLFVPDTVPPKMFMFIGFFLPDFLGRTPQAAHSPMGAF